MPKKRKQPIKKKKQSITLTKQETEFIKENSIEVIDKKLPIKQISKDISYDKENVYYKINGKTQTIPQINVKKWLGFTGYCLYLWHSESLNSTLYPLARITPIFRLKVKAEMFLLDKPAFFIDGKPVFIVLRGYPISITLELAQSKEMKTILKEKGYSASEIEAKLNSIYINYVFRKFGISTTTVFLWIMSIVLAVLTTYITLLNIWSIPS